MAHASSYIILNYVTEKANKILLIAMNRSFFFFHKLACLQKNFHGRVPSLLVNSIWRALWADGVYSPLNTIVPRDHLKPITMGENLVMKYKRWSFMQQILFWELPKLCASVVCKIRKSCGNSRLSDLVSLVFFVLQKTQKNGTVFYFLNAKLADNSDSYQCCDIARFLPNYVIVIPDVYISPSESIYVI